MKNAGLITYDESVTLKTYLDDADYYFFVYTLAHKLCHHWLGDYVTMNWWDDLWLN